MGKVIDLAMAATNEIPPQRILEGALKADLREVVVIGQRPDGTVYFAMSTAHAPDVNWMLDCAKRLLMEGVMDDDHG